MVDAGWKAVQDTLVTGIADLYSRLHATESNLELKKALYNAYFYGDPLVSALAVALFFSVVVWALSLPTNKHSWVDKLWSILPVFYVWHFALHGRNVAAPGSPVNPRLLVIATLVTVWGARLTFNFARKGGYRWSDEDYRWPYIRARVHPVLFQIFSIVFIAFIQSILLLAIAAPAYVAWQYRAASPPNWLDALATLLLGSFIVMEAVADQQQWGFQTAKHAKRAAGERLTGDYSKGFLTTGLFRYSRHPNFFAEQAIWWSVYLFSVAASGRWLNWSAAGVVALTALFQGSTWLTEMLTAQKYPKYRHYQASTSRLLPWWPAAQPEPKRRGRAAEAAVEDEGVTEGDGTDADHEEEEGSEEVSEEASEEEEEEAAPTHVTPPPRRRRAISTRARTEPKARPATHTPEAAAPTASVRSRRRKDGGEAAAQVESDTGGPPRACAGAPGWQQPPPQERPEERVAAAP